MLQDLLRKQVVPGHSFLVMIGKSAFSFSKVSNLESQIEYETVTEGGNAAFPYLFKKGKSGLDTLILERGVSAGLLGMLSKPFEEGMRLNEVTIIVQENKKPRKAFYIEWGVVVKRKFSDLDALRNELWIESLEIAHSGLHEMQISNILK